MTDGKSTKVTARDGDTLCSIGTANGFPNCDALRAEPANHLFLKRPLRAGDRITVPAPTPKTEPRADGASHRFVRRGVPIPSIRLVHGSRNLPYRSDRSLQVLNISNFRTDRGGLNGQRPFPAGYGYDDDGHADPDSFKVEVEDLGASGSVTVTLEAMKPIYAADGSVSRHESFGDATRTLEVPCNAVSAGLPVVFRSPYLRLVTDSVDQAAAAGQTLLVTDLADGLNGPNDQTEILDQQVLATVPIRACTVTGADACVARVQVPVGEDRRRLRLCLHVFRSAPGSETLVNGITEQDLRFRVNRWFRRALAQAAVAPKLVAKEIEIIDPPAPDTLVLCNDHGRTAAGTSTSGGPSALSFKIGSATATAADPVVTIAPTAGATPTAIGQAILAALPEGFSGSLFSNPRAFDAAHGSCDLQLRHDDDRRLLLYDAVCDDPRLTVDIAQVDLSNLDSAHPDASIMAATAAFRRILRASSLSDNQLDCFVIGNFSNAGLRGRAFVGGTDLAGDFQPGPELRYAAILATSASSGAVMDQSDNLPFTFPHEAGHVLFDAFHADRNGDPNGAQEMMASGTSGTNASDATKRICGGAYGVRYGVFNPAQPTPGAAMFLRLDAVDRLRSRSGSLLESW